jgi:Transposase DDE domain group 1
LTANPTTQCVIFPELFDRPVVVQFDEPAMTSNAGLLLLKAADRRLGLTERVLPYLPDGRDPSRVRHDVLALLQQRIYGLAAGYEDCNDAARLAADPLFKMLLGRHPITGADLATQSTLSRFENAFKTQDLRLLHDVLMNAVIDIHREQRRGKARVITIDLDTTVDPTHGAQQLTLFNGFHGTWCYRPLLGFIHFDKEPDQYLCLTMLRSGRAPDKCGVLFALQRLIPKLRKAFPKARIRVRLDAGFGAPEILNFLDATPRLEYVVGIAKNRRLLARVRGPMAEARRQSKASGESERVYADCTYKARKWPAKRRVVIKAEITRFPGRDPKDNPRFVVTNMTKSPRWIYTRVYCERGNSENRIKELKDGLQIDRTSCSSFLANQFRVFMTAMAYILMQDIRRRARRTSLARAQVATLRTHLFKIGARVVVSVRRVVLHLPKSCAYRDEWGRIALALGAVT